MYETSADRPELARLARVDLNLLVSLQVLLEERSVTRAAARVGLTQSAMSHSLSRCRRVFHDDLLTRVGHSLELTPRGRSLLGPLTDLLHRVDGEILGNPGFTPETSTRRFRVSLASSTAMVLLPALMSRLQRVAPGVTLQTVALMSRAEDMLERPEIDLVLLPDSLPSTLPRERLYTDRWMVITAVDNTSVGEQITRADLGTLPHVVFDIDGTLIQPYWAMRAAGVETTVRLRAHDFLLIPFLLRASDCVAVIQERIARRFATAGLVRLFSLPFEIPPLGIDMVWNPRLLHDPAQVWLRDLLSEVGADDQLV